MRLLSSLLLLGAVAAGCGSSGEEGANQTTATSTSTSSTSTTTTTTSAASSPSSTAPTTTAAADPAPTVSAEDVTFYTPDVASLLGFLASAPDEPFYMVNLVRYRDQAVYEDGRETDLSGEEADNIYGDFMRDEMLPSMGAEIIWAAAIEQDMFELGDFDLGVIVRYPSPDQFRAMSADPTFQEMLVHKRAGVEDTIVLAASRLDTPALPVPVDVPFPATDDDLPFAFMHLFDYRERAEYQPGDVDADPTLTGSEAVAKYSANAGIPAVPLGVRPVGWFNVEAVIVGDPGWEEVRVNTFPSHATLDALTLDPVWESGSHHRAAGLEQTHAFMMAPIEINELR